MVKALFALAALLCISLSGCTQPRVQPRVQQQVQYLEVTLSEGQTTKADILKAFGNPDDFGSDSLTYEYRHRSYFEGAKITYRQKDGTVFGVILQRGTDKQNAIFHLDEKGILHYAFWY